MADITVNDDRGCTHTRHDFVSGDVVNHDTEVNTLAAALEQIILGDTAEPAFVFKPSGTAKTYIAKYTVD